MRFMCMCVYRIDEQQQWEQKKSSAAAIKSEKNAHKSAETITTVQNINKHVRIHNIGIGQKSTARTQHTHALFAQNTPAIFASSDHRINDDVDDDANCEIVQIISITFFWYSRTFFECNGFGSGNERCAHTQCECRCSLLFGWLARTRHFFAQINLRVCMWVDVCVWCWGTIKVKRANQTDKCSFWNNAALHKPMKPKTRSVDEWQKSSQN